jgi:hypothetical protein
MSIRSRVPLLALAASLALSAGCRALLAPSAEPLASPPASAQPTTLFPVSATTEDTPRSGEPFYPLAVGNRWRHEKQFNFQIIPASGDPQTPEVFYSVIDREIACVEDRGGRRYFVEAAAEQSDVQTYWSWVRMRQDASGLHEADVSILDPPPCVPQPGRVARPTADPALRAEIWVRSAPPAQRDAYLAAARRLISKLAEVESFARPAAVLPTIGPAAEHEITRLRYPLFVGAGWVIRDDPGATFAARVEAAEVPDLPAGRFHAFRIRILPPSMGPADFVRVWYGCSGFLALQAHFDVDAIDAQGNVIGRAILDQSERLESLSLLRSGRFAGILGAR